MPGAGNSRLVKCKAPFSRLLWKCSSKWKGWALHPIHLVTCTVMEQEGEHSLSASTCLSLCLPLALGDTACRSAPHRARAWKQDAILTPVWAEGSAASGAVPGFPGTKATATQALHTAVTGSAHDVHSLASKEEQHWSCCTNQYHQLLLCCTASPDDFQHSPDQHWYSTIQDWYDDGSKQLQETNSWKQELSVTRAADHY